MLLPSSLEHKSGKKTNDGSRFLQNSGIYETTQFSIQESHNICGILSMCLFPIKSFIQIHFTCFYRPATSVRRNHIECEYLENFLDLPMFIWYYISKKTQALT